MTPLACFRFRASASEFLRYSLVLILLTVLMGIFARSDDQDGDGYDDDTGEWIGDPGYDPGSGDGDGDGLTDEEEILYYGTDPNAADTDDDGLRDAEEIFGVETFREEQYYSYTDYYYDDETGDYVYYDVYETYTTSTTVYPDPRDADTDRDLLPDGHEVGLGLDPTDPADGFGDVDGDGLGRGEEYLIGTRHDRADTDGDGIGDGAEIAAGSDPLDPASPGSPGEDPDPEGSDPSGGADSDPGESNGDPPLEGNGSTGGGDGDGAGDGGAGDDGGASGPGDPPPSPESDGDGSTGSPPAEPAPLDPRVHYLDADDKIAVLPEALWRAVYGFAIGDSGVDSADTDGDGLSNHTERLRGTHPRVADTDGDGLSDGEEISGYTVGEGYWSWEEVWTDYYDDSTGDSYSYSTTEHVWVPASTATSDPLRRDSNGNGRDDGADRLLDGYRHVSGGTPDEYTDDDGDLLMLYEESDIGTNPWEADSDGDGLSDSEEHWGFERTVETVREETRYVTEERYDEQTGETYTEDVPYQETVVEVHTYWVSTDPTNPDTDGDGLPDGYEVSHQLDPTNSADGLVDGDGDGLDRGEEFALGTSDSVPNGDLDGDGIADLREIREHSPPLRALGYPGFDAADPTDGAADYDHDGATNSEEDAAGTDLLDPDTDDDGILDGAELAAGTDPLVPDVAPAGEATGEGEGNENTGATGDGTGSDNPGDETGSGTEGDPTDTGGTTPDTGGTTPDAGGGGTGGSGGGSGGGSTTNPDQGDPDSAAGTGGPNPPSDPDGPGEQSDPNEPTEPILLTGLEGRTHRTVGGHYHAGQNDSGLDSDTITVQVADRFTAELVRNQFDAEGNQTEEEERTTVSGPADSLEDARQDWERDYWTEESITYTYRTETIETPGGPIEGSDPSTSEFYVEGPVILENSLVKVETLAEVDELLPIYEAMVDDPNGDHFWQGSVGSMGLTPGWSEEDRIAYGAVPYREPPDGSSYATFASGVVPQVAWSEYWMQAEEPLPEDERKSRTFLVHATRTISDEYGTSSSASEDNQSEWFGTVVFEIGPNEEISTEMPVVEWFTPGAPEDWLDARPDGILLVQPACERGEENHVRLLPVELKVYRPLEPSDAEKWRLTREERIIPHEEIEEEGIRIRQNLDDDNEDNQLDGNQSGTVSGENDLIEIEFKSEVPDGFELLIEKSSGLKIWTEQDKVEQIGGGSASEIVVPEAKHPPRSYWLEAVRTGELKDEELKFLIRPEGGGEKVELKKFAVNGFKSFVIGLSGEDFGNIPDVRDFGIFDVAQDLYLEGYNIAFYDEDRVGNDGGGAVFDEVDAQTQGSIKELGIYGWSHGGGSVYNLCDKIYLDLGAGGGGFSIPIAFYVDAIAENSTAPVTEIPVMAERVINFYQREGPLGGVEIQGVPMGVPVVNHELSLGIDGHLEIASNPVVTNGIASGISDALEDK